MYLYSVCNWNRRRREGVEGLRVCKSQLPQSETDDFFLFLSELRREARVQTLTLLVDSEKLQNFASTSRLVSFSLWEGWGGGGVGGQSRSLACYVL